ncbi:MAG TPA: hypothetical protein VFN19_09155, partial [Candidatus Nanopelagicales bacterium]|nr:hypothetical protein [Candidatus Nanopelagicales bacterium]
MGELTQSAAPSRPVRSARWILTRPWWPLPVALVAAAVGISAAVGRIRDIDLYWHLLVGEDLRAGLAVDAAGRGWSFAPVPDTWVSTQWLAELLLSWLEQLGGFTAVVGYRVVTVLLTLAVLAVTTLRRRRSAAVVVPFALGAIALASTSQERSQQLTYLLAPLVGWWAERLLREGRVPRWWIALPLTLVWANYHGGWVLLPMALTLTAVGRWTRHGWRDRAAGLSLLLAAGCGLVAMISPIGPANAFSALTFARVTSQIAEWQRVAPWSDQGWQLAAVLLVVVLCWARGRTRPGGDELVLVLGLVAFGFLTYRNITPAVLMLAPICAGILTRALPADLARPPRWPGLALGLAGLGALAALVIALLVPQQWQAGRPLGLFAEVAAHPGEVRVLNTYNVAGPLLWFGGRPPHVTVGID